MAAPRIEQLSETVTLYHGDAAELVGQVPRSYVPICDPPYGIAHVSNRSRRGRKASWSGKQIANDHDTSLRDFVLDGFDNVAAFGTWKTAPIPDACAALVWDKGPATGMGDLTIPWKLSWELCYIRGSIWQGHRDEGILRDCTLVTHESKGRVHPHQKPVSLVARLLNKLPAGTPILDPFMGSGSTGVACVQAGHPFIGFEDDAGHFETALRRISAEIAKPRLFKPEALTGSPVALFAADLSTSGGLKDKRSINRKGKRP